MAIKVIEHDFGYKVTLYIPNDSPPRKKASWEYSSPREVDYVSDAVDRAKRTIIDYSLNNVFNYFVTFTFDDNKQADSRVYDETSKKLRVALNHYKNRIDSNMRYVIVPELHKESHRIHFHALMYFSAFKDDKNNDLFDFLYYDDKKRHKVYRHNWFFEKFGSVHCVKINKWSARVGMYVSKYISKDLLQLKLKTYYTCSKGLKKSDTVFQRNETHDYSIAWMMSMGLEPSFRNDFCTIYNIDSESVLQSLLRDVDKHIDDKQFKYNLGKQFDFSSQKNDKSIYDFMEV